jgi:hypothetical protein
MSEVDALENKTQHQHDVNKIYNVDKGVIELSGGEPSSCNIGQQIAKEPIPESRHGNMDGEHEDSRSNESQHIHEVEVKYL